MDVRLLLLLVPAGFLVLALWPTWTPPPRVGLQAALEASGPVRVEGIVDAHAPGDDGVHVLLRNGTRVWVTVRDPPPLSPGDRVEVTARPQGGILVADGEDVTVLEANGVQLLRHVARDPWDREGPVRLNATVGQVHKTVLYLRDRGHRLRTVAGRGPWPPDVEPGDRVVADGRLRYDAGEMRYVLRLDGIR